MIDAEELARLREVFSECPAVIIPLIDELERARGEGERQYEYNVEMIARYAALEAKLDDANALLRKLAMGSASNALRARIADHLGEVE